MADFNEIPTMDDHSISASPVTPNTSISDSAGTQDVNEGESGALGNSGDGSEPARSMTISNAMLEDLIKKAVLMLEALHKIDARSVRASLEAAGLLNGRLREYSQLLGGPSSQAVTEGVVRMSDQRLEQVDGKATDQVVTTITASLSTLEGKGAELRDFEKGTECSICLVPFTSQCRIQPCGHLFDLECIRIWFKAGAPNSEGNAENSEDGSSEDDDSDDDEESADENAEDDDSDDGSINRHFDHLRYDSDDDFEWSQWMRENPDTHFNREIRNRNYECSDVDSAEDENDEDESDEDENDVDEDANDDINCPFCRQKIKQIDYDYQPDGSYHSTMTGWRLRSWRSDLKVHRRPRQRNPSFATRLYDSGLSDEGF